MVASPLGPEGTHIDKLVTLASNALVSFLFRSPP